ncbi:MAG: YsnF/AvaK domain-containing protein [Paracoccus sp. (in: a-proteobacteria)]|nr:YsnF/AvaK domain-containing protein [Paracoccus sp. (in: a-proteobacteria)]
MHHDSTGHTLSAMFDNRADADRAAARLREIGVTDVALHGEENAGYDATTRRDPAEERGFFDSLADFFFPEDDRATYAEGLNRGGYLVTARNVPEARMDEVTNILDSEGSVDLDAREAEWRDSGWDRGAYAAHGDRHHTDGEKLEVVEERLNIGKRDVGRGTVRVRSHVREEPVSQDVELTDERVDVTRRAVDRPAGDAAFQDRTIEAEERREEAVVSKEARVVEEIELSKTSDTRVERVEDTVRKTEVEIDEDHRDPNAPRRDGF